MTWLLVSSVSFLCLQSSCWGGGLRLLCINTALSTVDFLCSVSLPWATPLSAIVAFHGTFLCLVTIPYLFIKTIVYYGKALVIFICFVGVTVLIASFYVL